MAWARLSSPAVWAGQGLTADPCLVSTVGRDEAIEWLDGVSEYTCIWPRLAVGTCGPFATVAIPPCYVRVPRDRVDKYSDIGEPAL